PGGPAAWGAPPHGQRFGDLGRRPAPATAGPARPGGGLAAALPGARRPARRPLGRGPHGGTAPGARRRDRSRADGGGRADGPAVGAGGPAGPARGGADRPGPALLDRGDLGVAVVH